MPARAGQDEAIYGGDFFDLQDAVAQLAPVERNAFLLVTVGGWSREEAAQLTGVPATTLRSRVSRATKRLAATIGDRALPVPALR